MESTKRVLIVEDDLHIAELLRLHLRDEGYA
ncbi:MAG: DNA-binding response regulator, partial [Comamonas sp.]